MTISPSEVLTTIARSLVTSQRYASIEEALRGLALEEVKRKIARYQRHIRHFERKYGLDFEAFGRKVMGQETIEEEDDWLAWHAARRMLTDWEAVQQELEQHANLSS